MTDTTTTTTNTSALLERYGRATINVFGTPGLVLDHGAGTHVWDVDGKRYLDLLGGIAVNVLGHAHPAMVEAISRQAATLIHTSNFFTTRPQVELAEKILDITRAPEGSGVFFANSGTEAIEAAIKLSRRTGRSRIVAAEHAFHGRSMGALTLTHKAKYREPFMPLLPDVVHVPYADEAALRAAVTDETAAVFLEPIQGEAGVVPGPAAYLRLARDLTTEHGALLVLDEIQTGIGRTGTWFAFQESGIVPDAVTMAKGLGGGFPIAALATFGPDVTRLLTPGQHGTTFGGGPLACATALAVLATIENEDLLTNVRSVGDHFASRVEALGHPGITGVRGAGLLRAITLADPISAEVALAARDAGFIVNPVLPDALRIGPPLIITTDEIDTFVDALPGLVDTVGVGS